MPRIRWEEGVVAEVHVTEQAKVLPTQMLTKMVFAIIRPAAPEVMPAKRVTETATAVDKAKVREKVKAETSLMPMEMVHVILSNSAVRNKTILTKGAARALNPPK
jgi:hypothetical protein